MIYNTIIIYLYYIISLTNREKENIHKEGQERYPTKVFDQLRLNIAVQIFNTSIPSLSLELNGYNVRYVFYI